MKDFVSIRKAIEAVDPSLKTHNVRRLCQLREIVAFHTETGRWRVSVADLRDWLKRQKPIVGIDPGSIKGFS